MPARKESTIALDKPRILIAPDRQSWTELAANRIVTAARQAITARGDFTLALSGGTTPLEVYAQLVRMADQLDWQNVFLFWGDERCVPPDHPDSNFGQARPLLVDSLPIPRENVFRILGELEPATAARDYEEMLTAFFHNEQKSLDLVLLGLGEDGHTASLFPGSPALEISDRWVSETIHPATGQPRITLTFPAINQSREILFLVTGAGKAEVAAEVIQRPEASPQLPAKRVTGQAAPPYWLLDREAGGKLNLKG